MAAAEAGGVSLYPRIDPVSASGAQIFIEKLNEQVAVLGMSRSQWESLRKKRLGRSGSISTTLKDLQTTQCDGKTAEVSFTQKFDSAGYQDVVRKTLNLEMVKDEWKITRETVIEGRTF